MNNNENKIVPKIWVQKNLAQRFFKKLGFKFFGISGTPTPTIQASHESYAKIFEA